MGILTLSELRVELNMILGDNRQPGNTHLDRWINRAYFEIASLFEFEILKDLFTFSTVSGTAAYSYPTGVLAVLSLADLTNKRLLHFTALRSYHRLDREVESIPKLWTRRGSSILLWPTPFDVYSIEGHSYKEPTRLLVDGDISVFPAAWDHAILELAARNGLLAFGRAEQATFYYQSAVNYMRGLDTEHNMEMGRPAIGLTLADSFELMEDQLTEFPGE